MPEEKREQQSANVRSINIRVGHDNNAAVAQLRDVKAAFFFAVTVFFLRFADAGADGGDHGLDLVVLEELIFARFLDIDQFAANREDRLITPVASLLGRAAGRIALHNIKLG